MCNIILAIISLVQTSFYSLSFTDADGNTISMSAYQGKKVLLVNIATGSERVSQLADLQQLHQQYGDSVVIIAFPSNSFGNETRTNNEIKQFCQANYGVSFKIASKIQVAGINIEPVYSWLANAGENGVMDSETGSDFQKFLIGKDGTLMGVFSPSIKPTNGMLINALLEN